MTLVQAVNTAQIQQKIDEFANEFIGLYSLASDLVAFNANMTSANPMVQGLDGQPMTDPVMNELKARINALQTFLTWANAGAPSPLVYLRSVKRSV